MSLGSFVRFLLSDATTDLDTTEFRLNSLDLHHPLSHYYIATSHNTYLTGLLSG